MICNTNKLDESVQRFALLHSPLEGEPFVSHALLICLIDLFNSMGDGDGGDRDCRGVSSLFATP
jgi:hypothetical protein